MHLIDNVYFSFPSWHKNSKFFFDSLTDLFQIGVQTTPGFIETILRFFNFVSSNNELKKISKALFEAQYGEIKGKTA